MIKYVNHYFSQDDSAGYDLELLDYEGAEALLGRLASAGVLDDGETLDSPPWGTSDQLEYTSEIGNDLVVIYTNRQLNYLSVTRIIEDDE